MKEKAILVVGGISCEKFSKMILYLILLFWRLLLELTCFFIIWEKKIMMGKCAGKGAKKKNVHWMWNCSAYSWGRGIEGLFFFKLFRGLSSGKSHKSKMIEWQSITNAVNAAGSERRTAAGIGKRKWSDFKVNVKRSVAAQGQKCYSHRWRSGKARKKKKKKKETTLSSILNAHEGTSDTCGHPGKLIKSSASPLLLRSQTTYKPHSW